MDSASLRTTVVFDAQWTSLTTKSLASLQATLFDNPRYTWIVDAIHGLPDLWSVATKTLGGQSTSSIASQLATFSKWTQSATSSDLSLPLSNALLTPITVIMELVQFMEHVEKAMTDSDKLIEIDEVLGFCTGLLSASAVASSRDRSDLQKERRRGDSTCDAHRCHR